MNALVGYGVSSSSDSDGEASDEHSNTRSNQEGCQDKPVKSRNFLLEADSGSASSDSEEPEEEQPIAHLYGTPRGGLPSPTLSSGMNKLPPPSLQACSDTSVFTNPFKAQADQKLHALQKHVPLTEQARPSHIGGRRICVSYRKDGRCRFGIKCKYAHDSDLQTQPADCHLQTGREAHTSACGAQGPQGNQHDTEDKSEGQKVTKKRVGLSNTLIPPKRAMKRYAMQREKEGGHI
ncbi:uncharacterized protein si:ch211-113e8.11 isoform X1 [Periophthalmus magnuspinnatus]|uniref:uncharacterized protein si:ch211-113e8.11 isoform X1 n=1 Tax=Periophthalmus magnuspinnatus TaxID=409849 RepID=UPI00243706E8|nr:uncharacterized protein si:ch211-113e8.11 isoform X1 [Periophthalmus magnuspinnatus]